MSHTIATLEETQGNLSINLDSTGNKYLVGIYNNETKEYTHKTFDTMDSAYAAFSMLSKYVCLSLYTEKEKRGFLLAA